MDAATNGVLVADIKLMSPTTSVVSSTLDSMYDPSFSPDGAAIAGTLYYDTDHGRAILAMNRAGDESTHRLATFPGGVVDQAWSPDGRRVAVIWTDADWDGYRVSIVRVNRSAPPRPLLTTGTHGNPFTQIAWSAATNEVAVLTDDDLIFLSPNGTQARNLSGPCTANPPRVPYCTGRASFGQFDLAPDGGSVVVQTPEQTLATVTDDGSVTPVPLTDGNGDPVHGQMPVWSPDGTTIAFHNLDPEAPGVTLIPATGGTLQLLRDFGVTEPDDWQPCPGGSCPRFQPRYSPDLSVTADHLDASIAVHGVLFDYAFAGQPVTVSLRRWSDDRYVLVERTTSIVGTRGKYQTTFGDPGRGRCRVTTHYAGEEFFYLPSQAHADLRC